MDIRREDAIPVALGRIFWDVGTLFSACRLENTLKLIARWTISEG